MTADVASAAPKIMGQEVAKKPSLLKAKSVSQKSSKSRRTKDSRRRLMEGATTARTVPRQALNKTRALFKLPALIKLKIRLLKVRQLKLKTVDRTNKKLMCIEYAKS
jgi:hypothetical protein